MWFIIAHASTVRPLIQLDNGYLGMVGGLSISGGRRLAAEKLAKAFVKLKQQKNQTILDSCLAGHGSEHLHNIFNARKLGLLRLYYFFK